MTPLQVMIIQALALEPPPDYFSVPAIAYRITLPDGLRFSELNAAARELAEQGVLEQTRTKQEGKANHHRRYRISATMREALNRQQEVKHDDGVAEA